MFSRVSADAKRNLYVFPYVFKINKEMRRMTNNTKTAVTCSCPMFKSLENTLNIDNMKKNGHKDNKYKKLLKYLKNVGLVLEEKRKRWVDR